MPCYSPLQAYRHESETSSSGKRAIVFTPADTLSQLQLPCGQCIGCKLERSRQWAIRCMLESSLHEENCFITLTLDENQSLERKTTLIKKDFQDFMKRLRKKFPAKKITYLYCGEYGEKYQRPHYHACIFGLDFPDKKLHKRNSGNPLYTSEILTKLWQNKGHCLIGSLTFESAAYVSRYCTKKLTGPSADEYYCGRLPEYINMSLKPAIGLRWIDKYHSDVYPSDEVVVRNRKLRPPKYFDKYYEKHFPEAFEKTLLRREELAHQFEISPENTPERLNAKHEFQLNKNSTLRRTLESDAIDNVHHKQDYDRKAINYKKGVLYET